MWLGVLLPAAIVMLAGVLRADPIDAGRPGPDGSHPTLGTGAHLSFSIVAGGTRAKMQNVITSSQLSVSLDGVSSSTRKQRTPAAFDAWSAVANFKFEEVANGGEAYGSEPPGVSGDIHLRANADWTETFDGASGQCVPGSGVDVFRIAVHEIGHAIGLHHSGDTPTIKCVCPSEFETFRRPQRATSRNGKRSTEHPFPNRGRPC